MLKSPAIETESGIRLTMDFSAFYSSTDMGLEVTLMNAVAAADL